MNEIKYETTLTTREKQDKGQVILPLYEATVQRSEARRDSLEMYYYKSIFVKAIRIQVC